MQAFSKFIRDYCEEHNMNQREFSKLCGISENTICRYINNDREPTLRSLLKIGHAVNLDFTTLYDLCYEELEKGISK